jgi:hypothetical protein
MKRAFVLVIFAAVFLRQRGASRARNASKRQLRPDEKRYKDVNCVRQGMEGEDRRALRPFARKTARRSFPCINSD